jgi:hypothetical protein
MFMAHLRRSTVLFSDGGQETVFFANVDFAVGRGKSNLTADVQLVQVLLDFLAKLALEPDTADLPLQARDGNIIRSVKADGIFGTKTRNAIIAAQEFFNEEEAFNGGTRKVLVDGIIDSIDANSTRSSISKTLYTLVKLNERFVSSKGHTFGLADTTLEPLRSNLEESQSGGSAS